MKEYWIPSALRRQSLIAPTTFSFLNETYDLDTIGWDHPNVSKLWRYNLHYFYDLQSDKWQSRNAMHKVLIQAWITDNPLGQGTGWEPYPLSLRVINWIKWAISQEQLPHTFNSILVDSLAQQARWLLQNLEWHLLGNHLFSNAKALIFLGLFFPRARS